MLTDEVRFRLLRMLADHPEASQREIARELGFSLGKVNFCLKALVEKGLVKIANFGRSSNKQRYAYLLTARGAEDKARMTLRFLNRKLKEYEALESEIRQLQSEALELRRIKRGIVEHD
ncbi:MAG: MarR family EPS-associated transcriptional regulator [Gammaproteobacteria bacterium]